MLTANILLTGRLPGQDTEKCVHPTPKVRQKKPGIIRVSGQLPLHQGNKANGLDGINDKFVAPTTDPFEKLMLFADRQHQHAVIIQLRQQRGRYFRRLPPSQ